MSLLLVAFALGIVLGFWLAIAVIGGLLIWLALSPRETDIANVAPLKWRVWNVNTGHYWDASDGGKWVKH